MFGSTLGLPRELMQKTGDGGSTWDMVPQIHSDIFSIGLNAEGMETYFGWRIFRVECVLDRFFSARSHHPRLDPRHSCSDGDLRCNFSRKLGSSHGSTNWR